MDSEDDNQIIGDETETSSGGFRIENDMDSFGTLSDEDLLNNEDEFM